MSSAAIDDSVILQFLAMQPMAVVATIAPDSQPESALIAFAQTANLEIIFETFEGSRKWKNVQQNPRVALVIGWDTTRYITVQYEGIAAPVEEADLETYIQIFLAKETPCTEQFLRDPRARFFKVQPTWIRYSDYTLEPPRIIERRYKS